VKKSQRFVGFDCGEDAHSAVLLDSAGKFARRYDVVNERGEIQELLAGLMLDVVSEAHLVVVVESTRSHGRIVADVATELGCELWRAPSKARGRGKR